MTLKPFIVVVASLTILTASSARAGLAEEKKAREDVTAATTKASDTIKTACGCTPSISIDWDSLKSIPGVTPAGAGTSKAPAAVKSVSEGVAELCKDFKKEVCAGVSKIVVVGSKDKSNESAPSYDKASKTLTSVCSWAQCSGAAVVKHTLNNVL